jgi:hypothetical protein
MICSVFALMTRFKVPSDGRPCRRSLRVTDPERSSTDTKRNGSASTTPGRWRKSAIARLACGSTSETETLWRWITSHWKSRT